MNRRWLHSRWLWLVVCVAVGSLAVTIPSLQALHQLLEIVDAFSSGVRDGLKEGGFSGKPKESRRVSVAFLFGLVEIKDTQYPYLWTAVSGIVTGGGLGAGTWGVVQLGLWGWRRATQRAACGEADRAGAADP